MTLEIIHEKAAQKEKNTAAAEEIKQNKSEEQGDKAVKTPEKFVIKGGRALHGEVEISGAKNAVVAILPAVILCDEPCVIENVPEIGRAHV